MEHGTQFEGRPTDPVSHRGSVEIDALAAHDLRLPIERKVIGIFGDQHMGDGRFRRQPSLDQASRGWSLNDTVSAGTASIFGAAGDNDAELRRDHVQPLGDIFANAMQATAAGADQAFRLDHLLHTGKMLRKGAAIGRAWLGNPVSSRSVRLILGMDHGHGRFQVFQCQIELIGIGLLGFASEGCLLEGRNQLLKPFDPLILASDMFVLAGYRNILGRLADLRRDQHRLQGGDIIGKVGGIKHGWKLPNSEPICLRNLRC